MEIHLNNLTSFEFLHSDRRVMHDITPIKSVLFMISTFNNALDDDFRRLNVKIIHFLWNFYYELYNITYYYL